MLCIKKDGETDGVYTNSIHNIFVCMYTIYRVLLVGNEDVLKTLCLPKSGRAGSTRFLFHTIRVEPDQPDFFECAKFAPKLSKQIF